MRISELVIACFDLSGMLKFYKNVFDISFKEIEIQQGKIYEGHVDTLKIILCSATIARIKAEDNRHQLTFLVTDIRGCIEKSERFGGSSINALEETNDSLQIAIRDVDSNSIVLKQRKN